MFYLTDIWQPFCRSPVLMNLLKSKEAVSLDFFADSTQECCAYYSQNTSLLNDLINFFGAKKL
jgi:hypothetical protein